MRTIFIFYTRRFNISDISIETYSQPHLDDFGSESAHPYSTIECGAIPETLIMNRDLIVEYQYAYFHHDDEDVQQNPQNFITNNSSDFIKLCSGDECI